MGTLAGLLVLVLEDNSLIATDLEALLREFGCDVIGPFRDPAGAVAAVKIEKPQAAVLDINHNGKHTWRGVTFPPRFFREPRDCDHNQQNRRYGGNRKECICRPRLSA